MAKHIGIVACSAEGAALCYRTVARESARLLSSVGAGGAAIVREPEVSLHTAPYADYVRALERDDWAAVGALMLGSAQKLAEIGADVLICPDNTIHRGLPLIRPRLPRPWLHIAEVVAAEAARRGLRRLGLLGTRWLVDGDVYPRALGAHAIGWERPSPVDRDRVHHVIMDELVAGVLAPQSTAALLAVVERLRAAGCDGIVLGCTELPLVLSDENAALPTLDSTRLLGRAAVDWVTRT